MSHPHTQVRLVQDAGLWGTETERNFNVSADTPTMQMSMRHLISEDRYRIVSYILQGSKARVSCTKSDLCKGSTDTPLCHEHYKTAMSKMMVTVEPTKL